MSGYSRVFISGLDNLQGVLTEDTLTSRDVGIIVYSTTVTFDQIGKERPKMMTMKNEDPRAASMQCQLCAQLSVSGAI